MYSYLTCNVKLCIQNIKFEIINQHINHTCHTQSFEKDSMYLGIHDSFYCVFNFHGCIFVDGSARELCIRWGLDQ
jgi:hypothetical protein